MKKLKIGYEIKDVFPEIPDDAIEFLLSVNEDTEPGKRYFGEVCFVNVINANTRTEHKPMEAHENYIDVQCLITGEEKILYADKFTLAEHKPYNPETDCAFYSFDQYDEVIYGAGEAVVLYTKEAHLPGLAVSEPIPCKKAVLKVKCK